MIGMDDEPRYDKGWQPQCGCRRPTNHSSAQESGALLVDSKVSGFFLTPVGARHAVPDLSPHPSQEITYVPLLH